MTMSVLSGKKANDYIEWLMEAKKVLPPKMGLEETITLFERKLMEEEELRNEEQAKEGV